MNAIALRPLDFIVPPDVIQEPTVTETMTPEEARRRLFDLNARRLPLITLLMEREAKKEQPK